MTVDEYLQTPWLEGYETVPEKLRSVLRLYGNTRRFDLTYAIADELGVKTADASDATWRLMLAFVRPLATAVEEGERFLEDRPMSISGEAVRNLDMAQCSRALVELGWGSHRLNGVAVNDLTDALRVVLASHLTPHVQRMMLRWAARGVFGS